jgi:hypothetical protein
MTTSNKLPPRRLGSRSVLGGVIASAVASVMACGSNASQAAAQEAGLEDGGSDAGLEDGSSAADTGPGATNDASPDVFPSCPSPAMVSTVQNPGGPDAGWLTTYGVDPMCCAPQLFQFATLLPEAGITGAACFTVQDPCVLDVDVDMVCQSWCDLAFASVSDASPGGPWTCPSPFDGGLLCGTGAGGCSGGRPPRGFAARYVAAATALGARLAIMAQLEDASVAAFDALHADLVRLGAPVALQRSVRAARKDEVRHARLVSREAARHGAIAPAAVVNPIAPRSLEQLAIDNAEEGCVVETFGAALLTVQAERAGDPRLRKMFRSLAADELRHAALSWRIAAWLEARLSTEGKLRVARARGQAVASLERQLLPSLSDDALGIPEAPAQRILLSSIRGALETGQVPDAA